MFETTDNLQFTVHGGGDGDGLAGALEALLGGIDNLLNLPAAEILPAVFPGIAAMANWHPLFVHFPIALLTVFFGFDLIANLANKPDWRKAAAWFLYAGTAFAGIAVALGLHAASEVAHSDDVHAIMETHEHLGITIFLLAAVLTVWRVTTKSAQQGIANILFLFFAGILSLLIVFAADLGGLMVYQYGVAVAADAVTQNSESHGHHHEHSHDD